MATTQSATVFDPDRVLATQAFAAGPYPTFARMRRECPVFRSERFDFFMVTRYDDCMAVIRDTGTFSNAERAQRSLTAYPEDLRATMMEVYAGFRGFFFSDPPEYTAHRTRVLGAFRPGIARIESVVEDLVERLLAPVRSTGRIDLVRDLAYPLPATVILEIMGLPEADRDQFKAWSDQMVLLMTPDPSEETARTALASMRDAAQWFRGVVDEARRNPQGMLGVLVRDLPDEPSDEELQLFAVTFVQFLVAGHETTTNLIASTVWLLLNHPQALDRVRADRSLVPKAIEEALRLEPPLQWIGRRAAKDVEVAGVAIPAGATVNIVIGSANRDEQVFPDPDSFVVDRAPNRHLSLGYGPHFCLGAPLARLEARVVVNHLLDTIPDLALVEPQPLWSSSAILHGLRRLDLTFAA